MKKRTMRDGKRNGMLVAGNWIMDKIQVIDHFPAEQSLVNIVERAVSNGGSAYNISINLRKLAASFPLEALGLLGDDEEGRHIIAECTRCAIDTKQLHIKADAQTAHTIVLSVKHTGKRTFLHYRGANALLNESHFDFSTTHAKIFHLGYLLLLDQLDEILPGEITGAARVLEQAQKAGMLTSVDLVSEDSDRFTKIIPYSLPFVDFLFLNEYEASRLSGIDIGDQEESGIFLEQCRRAAREIGKMGVRQYVFIHFPKGVMAIHREGHEFIQAGLNIPGDRIKGANGAGDALAAGVLFGIHEEWPIENCLKLGVSAAAASLFHTSCSEAVLSYDRCLEMEKKYGLNDTLKQKNIQ